MPFRNNVVRLLCDPGVNELSTLNLKQTACLGFALKSYLLTKAVSSWCSKRANVVGQWGRVTMYKGRGSVLFHLNYEGILCSMTLKLNPLILPGNNFKGS